MKELEKTLSGGDLRTLGKSQSVIIKIQNQNDFDILFNYLFHKDRLVVMRTADLIEKITINNPHYLNKHKRKIIELFNVAKNIELKWHLALIVPRLHLDSREYGNVWYSLTKWAKDKTNSRLVRVSAIQGLFEIVKKKRELQKNII